MVNSAKRARRSKLAQEAQRREVSRSAHQMDPVDLSRPGTDENEEEDREILFVPQLEREEESPPVIITVQAASDCEILIMVKTLNGATGSVSQDTDRIRRAYDQLRADNIARDKALADLSAMVREYGSPPATTRPHPVIRTYVVDGEGNLRAADIGITWAGSRTGPTTTGDTFDAADSSGCGDSTAPSTTGDTSEVSTDRPHSTLQQQIPELAGVV